MSFLEYSGLKGSRVLLLYNHFAREKFLSQVIALVAPLGVFVLSKRGFVTVNKLGKKSFGFHTPLVLSMKYDDLA